MYVWMDIRVGGRVGYGWINGNKVHDYRQVAVGT